jgi:hypothetical protein
MKLLSPITTFGPSDRAALILAHALEPVPVPVTCDAEPESAGAIA